MTRSHAIDPIPAAPARAGRRIGQASIQLRLVAIAIAVAMPLLMVNGLQLLAGRGDALRSAEDETGRVAAAVAAAFDRTFLGAREALVAIATDDEVQDLDAGPCNAVMAALLPQYPDYANLGAADLDGNLVCSAVPLAAPVSVADRSYFRRAVEHDAFAIGEYALGRVSGQATIVVALPIHGTDGKIRGIVLASIPLRTLDAVVEHLDLPSGASVTVIDRGGTILVRRPDPEAWVGRQKLDAPIIAALLAGTGSGEGGSHGAPAELIGIDGELRLYAAEGLGYGDDQAVHVAIGYALDEAYAIADGRFATGMIVLGSAALIAIAIAWWVSRALIVAPLEQLSAVARRLAAGDLGARTGLAGRGEFGRLAETFDDMAASVQDRVEARTAELANVLEEVRATSTQLAEQAALVDGTRDGLFIFTPDTLRFGHVNQGAVDQLGFSREELLAMTPLDVKPRFDEASFRAMLAPLVDGRLASHRFETVHRRKDGTELPVEILLQAVRPDGGDLRLIAIVRDISERVEADRRIREYLDIAVDPLIVSRAVRDPATGEVVDFEVTFANEPAREFPGPEATRIGSRLTDLAPDLAAARVQMYSAVLADGRRVEYESTFPDAGSGEPRDLQIRLSRVGDGVAISFRDVTVAKHLQRALESARAEAEQARVAAESARAEAERANASKTEFLSRMSHELRTPLNAVIGFAQLLELDGLKGEQRESVHQILSGGRHLLELINEVLDISRIETGSLAISPEPVEVAEAVRESVDLVSPLAATRTISIGVETGVGGHVLADRQRFKQVLLNLLSNAVKFNRPGGAVTVTTARPTPATCRIEIRDEGPGISAAMRSRVFAPFDRLGAEATGVEGIGLGLALSKALMERMGGRIGFDSEPGAGSTFWLELPRTESDRRQASDPTPAARPAGPSLTGTILQIEDNLSNLHLVERILARHGDVRVIPAMLGGIGLELAREHRPDLILLDVHLPDMAGDSILARLRSDPVTATIPVVILSADATPSVVERLLARGAAAFLAKPIDIGEFIATVRRLLANEPSGPAGG